MLVIAQLGSPSQWLILIVICLVIFGAKRLPDIARNLGRSLAAFKKAKQDFEQELLESEKHPQDSSADTTPKPDNQQKQ